MYVIMTQYEQANKDHNNHRVDYTTKLLDLLSQSGALACDLSDEPTNSDHPCVSVAIWRVARDPERTTNAENEPRRPFDFAIFETKEDAERFLLKLADLHNSIPENFGLSFGAALRVSDIAGRALYNELEKKKLHEEIEKKMHEKLQKLIGKPDETGRPN